MGALLGMALVQAALLLGAHEVLLKVRLGRFSVDLLLFLLIRLALVSGVVLVSLCTHTFNASALGIAGGAALLALLAGGAHRRIPRWRDHVGSPLILVCTGLLALRLLLQVWFLAPFLPDVLSYHLPKMAEWVRAGGLTLELGMDERASFPAGFELVEASWVVFLRHDVLIEMAGVEFLAFGAVAAGALARQLGLAPRSAAVAALLFALVPGMHLQATAAMNDAPLAAVFLATAVLILTRAPWALILLAAGVGVGIKPTFVYLSPGLALLAWGQGRARATEFGKAPRTALVLASLGVLLGGFWYARNTVVYKNPLHPMTSRGILDSNGEVLIPSSPSLENLGWNLLALERRLDDRVGPYSAQLTKMAGWGVGPVALGLPALLWLLRGDRGFRRVAGAFACSLFCLLVSISTDPYNLRFALFFSALPCIAAVRMTEQVPAIRMLPWAAMALQFLGTFMADEIPNGGLRDLVATPWRERQGTGLPAVKLPQDVIGVFAGGASRAYLLYGPDFGRRVTYLRSPDLASLAADLRREGVTLLQGGTFEPVIREAVASGLLVRDLGKFYRVRR